MTSKSLARLVRRKHGEGTSTQSHRDGCANLNTANLADSDRVFSNLPAKPLTADLANISFDQRTSIAVPKHSPLSSHLNNRL